jgi:hypothetical protein
MAVLTVQEIGRAGVTPSFTSAAGGGDTCPNDEKTFLEVKNGGGASIDVTVETPGTVDGLAITDRVVAVPASGDKMIGPFPKQYYSATLDITYSAVTSVTIGAFRLPRG